VDGEVMNGQRAQKLQAVFRAVFDLPEGCDVTQLRQDREGHWDSLAHVSLVMAIESEFAVTIDAADALRMTSYAETRLLLEEMSP
jgi:acyl carrier protein